MRYNFLIIIFFLTSCTVNSTKLENRVPYNTKGFAYIFNEMDFQAKIIKGKLNNDQLQVSHKELKPYTLIKIINPLTNESLTISNTKKIKYPDFYKILITEKVADKLNLQKSLPLVEIMEIKRNKSFIAKKAKIFKEEKKIPSKAPITSVEIANISKNKDTKKNFKTKDFNILIGTFYSKETAIFLKQRINKEIPNYDIKKLKIAKKSNKKVDLVSGPYNEIDLMKIDYMLLKEFGFEDLDISIDE